MADTNSGGPAFPVLKEYAKFNDHIGQYEDYYAPHGGMSLRDYFAAKAMQGGLAARAINAGKPSVFAAECYAMADAMLKARG